MLYLLTAVVVAAKNIFPDHKRILEADDGAVLQEVTGKPYAHKYLDYKVGCLCLRKLFFSLLTFTFESQSYTFSELSHDRCLQLAIKQLEKSKINYLQKQRYSQSAKISKNEIDSKRTI